MVRLTSIMISAALLGLFSLCAPGAALAETGAVTVGTAAQTTVQSLDQAASPATSAAATPAALRGPEQRVALVIGNANYENAPKLANPGNDAQSMAELLNAAGFEVISATDLRQGDMVKVLRDFSDKVAARGPSTVAMIYYAGHGVQLAGENYLIPVDAKIATPSDLDGHAVRLVDVMGTLENIPSRTRIVVLDACRNNPFPNVNDAGRGLAVVDAPNGSIVGYSTAPGMEAQDGNYGHSPYTNAFLRLAREPNLPIEQLFKRVRLEVNSTTDGRQTPWESSSLTSDFYFFGDTAVASSRAPANGPVVQMASNLPNRSVRQAYDFVLSEGRPEYYEEFIRLYPRDPLCDRIRSLLTNWLQVAAWHKAVLANTPFAYKTFHDNFAGGPYAQQALKLQAQPKAVPLMQFTRLSNRQALQPIHAGLQGAGGNGQIGGGRIVNMPAPGAKPAGMPNTIGKGNIASLPAANAGKTTSSPIMRDSDRHRFRTGRQSMQVDRTRSGGGDRAAVHSTPSGSHVGGIGGGHHGGFRH
ncbi:caspase domain-containing protein [Bradyrhizobium macuxiense]|uniref:Caspase domain-containing protein n=1 Tax=Bradyrhizobium macuxiense TaxID=1755647 RepID=A0A560LRS0_9BRAD|nr:caspase family protein [Bradyrhizobium macuxiense]TWB97034.1 caspase domain-containing protein [Bradyrhizobium macuxiense]